MDDLPDQREAQADVETEAAALLPFARGDARGDEERQPDAEERSSASRCMISPSGAGTSAKPKRSGPKRSTAAPSFALSSLEKTWPPKSRVQRSRPPVAAKATWRG